jgi:hypothetical protein
MKGLPKTIDIVLRPMTREPTIRDRIEKRKNTHFEKSDMDK